ncbi:hypothetical protein FSW04_16775 [Baekduia soli]|uniref:PQ-loop repeat-containing protein n=1 Tax=Baekduia soli TaxID=496014 RepID=A0A5B8U7Z8_9ACTN|nr:hypothetical protein [Baekduia soli]QEC49065.1 hypothetical protein FSW04_16775 [Baekduia soli]
MTLLALCSSAAIVIGLGAALPQLAAMLRSRSAAGQSTLGWCLGALVNSLMAYVNLAGYHAVALAAGNVASVAICLAAVGLVLRFGDRAPGPAPAVDGLATSEFWALRDALEHEAHRRHERAALAAA